MQKTNLKWVVAQKLEYLWWIRYLKKKNPSEYLNKKNWVLEKDVRCH